MKFFHDKITMAQSNGQLAIRISTLIPRESFVESDWCFGMKRVEEYDNPHGVYAINLYHFICGFDWYFRVLIAQSRNIDNIRVVFLNVDKSSIIKDNSPMEISFKRANILKEMTLWDFRQYVLGHCGFDSEYTFNMLDSSILASKMLVNKDYNGWADVMGRSKWAMYQKLGQNFDLRILKSRIDMSVEDHIKDCRVMVDAIEKLYFMRSHNTINIDDFLKVIFKA